MSWLDGLTYRLRALLFPRRIDREQADEVDFHLSLEAMQRTAVGADAEAARLQARREFGNPTALRQELRELGLRSRVDGVTRDLRYGFRRLKRSPTYALTVIATLSIGVGAIAAIGALVWGIALRPLPYPAADRLVQVQHTAKPLGATGRAGLSDGLYLEYSGSGSPFEAIAVYVENDGVALTDREEPVRLPVAVVSPSLFGMLGARPSIGRLFSPADERPGAEPVVIISHSLWTTRYGADPAIVGRSIELNRKAFRVVGVIEPGFAFPSPGTAVWYARTVDPAKASLLSMEGDAIGRLRPGVTLEAAEAAMDRLIAAAARRDSDATPALVAQYGFRPVLTPLKQALVRGVRDPLRLLAVAASLLWLVTLANAANLVLIRTEQHRREVAIGRALGATEWDVGRRVLTEIGLLAAAGAVGGSMLAAIALRSRLGFGPDAIPRLYDAPLGSAALVLVGLLAVVITIVLAAVATRPLRAAELLTTLYAASPRAGRRVWGRTQRWFAGGQVAFATALLVSAGLLGRSLIKLTKVELGFVPDHVALVGLDLPFEPYHTYSAGLQFYRDVLAKIQAATGLPAEAASSPPLAGARSITSIMYEGIGTERSGDAVPPAMVNLVTPGYFRLLQVPLLSGRWFDRNDMNQGVPNVIVSAELGRRLFGSEDPLGREIREVGAGVDAPRHRIVGVVGNVPGLSIADGPGPWVYFPLVESVGLPRQARVEMPVYPGYTTILIGTDAMAAAVAPTVRRLVHEVDPKVPVARWGTLRQSVMSSMARLRLTTILVLIGAVAALLLGAIGVYGVIAYLVGQRTREFGVRLALGATPRSVERLVARQASAAVAVGLLSGLSAGLMFAVGLRGILYRVSVLDPVVLFLTPGIVIALVTIACYVPARRAGRTDPVVALGAD